MSSTEQHTCCEDVPKPNHLGFRPCGNKAKVECDGKWYCGIHDPEKIAARRAKQEAKWKEESEKRDQRRAAEKEDARRAAMFGELVSALHLCIDALDSRQSWDPELAERAYQTARAAISKAKGNTP